MIVLQSRRLSYESEEMCYIYIFENTLEKDSQIRLKFRVMMQNFTILRTANFFEKQLSPSVSKKL